MTYDDSCEKQTTPLLSTRTEKASVDEICSIIGVEVSQSVIAGWVRYGHTAVSLGNNAACCT